ncbi:copper chaperone PCu(A)C [Gemmatimonas sp.]|uniref:copper chaperone PCu(A)C n=1 Tax=Gemmatimonas sp. TaxID=1962908 RepID=UPI0027B9B55D|nr:copper chaperone PCu(A)C [Gemmatimonas sp.]
MLTVLAAACSAPAAPQGRTITAAWARSADSGATGGAYLTIVNADSVAVELVGASSPVATSVEVHESMQHDGMSHMMPRASVSIGARDSLVMAPGGLHVMLNQLTRALTAGDSLPLSLRFSNGDSVLVNVPVRAP